MICKKCGFENNETSQFCQKCGKSLHPRPYGKVWLITGSIVAGVAIIVAAIFLFLLPNKSELAGAWHNEEMNQLLRFHEDGTVMVRTSSGDFEADYLLDKGGERGVITLNGTAISFTVSEDSLLLTSNGLESHYSRGEMDVVQATATPTAAPTPTETVSNNSSQNGTVTAAPADTPTPVDTVTPVPPDDPPDSDGNDLVPYAATPIVLPDSDIISGLTQNEMIGTWVNTESSGYILEFESDWSFSATVYRRTFTGTYTFNSTTGSGTMTYSDGSVYQFGMSDDMINRDDGKAFVRED